LNLSAFYLRGPIKKWSRKTYKTRQNRDQAPNIFSGRGKSRNELIQYILFDSY
jgi:hypothetical protein